MLQRCPHPRLPREGALTAVLALLSFHVALLMPRCPQSLSLKGTVFSSPTYFHAWWWWWCLPCAHLLLLTHSFSFPLYFFSPMMLQPPSVHLPPLFIDATLSSQSLLLILKYLWLLTHPPPLTPSLSQHSPFNIQASLHLNLVPGNYPLNSSSHISLSDTSGHLLQITTQTHSSTDVSSSSATPFG